jgi:NADPH:quinone reductase-like Zn-dependent oxidoreductase
VKAAIFEKPGLDNLKVVDNVELPNVGDHDILIKVHQCGVNPIDYKIISGLVPAKPMPHIPGCEISGTIEKIGSHLVDDSLSKGDKVIVHSRLSDGTCDMCLNGLDMLCRNGGIIGAITNGGFAEYIAIPQRSVFKIPEKMEWDMAASLPVTTLTSFHALKEASLKFNEYILIFGASGNTGMMAIQFAKRMGAKVIAVSKHEWIKDFGADYIIREYDKVVEKVKEITNGKMADVVLNSVGIETWDNSFNCVGTNGRLVSFGGLTGSDVKINVQSLYQRQVKLIGSNGGTLGEIQELIDISEGLKKTKTWKRFKLDETKEAIKSLSSKERDGRILLEID